MRLRDKVAIVTGSGNGIGKATSQRLAEEGANIVVADIEDDDARQTAHELQTDSIAVECDISDEDDVERMVEECIDEFGKLDILVNNAGVREYGPVTEKSEGSWDRILGVNLKGTAFCSKYGIPIMQENDGGSVVNVSSIHAVVGRPEMAQYDATKSGITGLTRSMACDHADDGIRVNAILPGATLTEFHVEERGYDPDLVEPQPDGPGVLNRWARPREVANGILFLASDESSYMTGRCLQMDGGMGFVENV
jgi:NAD(P)-dependent dehydrogenase (short-subunit alcohol dehydrogenase family)